MCEVVETSTAPREWKKWVRMLGVLGPELFALVLVRATATLTNTNPYVVPKGKGSGGGRPTGSDANWRLKYLITELTGLIDRCGGEIPHHDRDPDKGTMLEILNILRPIVPAGVIQHAPPLGTIQKARSAGRKKRL